jgi:hypothetical protein
MNFILAALLVFDLLALVATNYISKKFVSKTVQKYEIAQQQTKASQLYVAELVDEEDEADVPKIINPNEIQFKCEFCGRISYEQEPCPCRLDKSITSDSSTSSLKIDKDYKAEYDIVTIEDNCETILYDTHSGVQESFCIGSVSDIVNFTKLAEEELQLKGTYKEFTDELAYQMFLRDLCRLKGYDENEIDHLMFEQGIDPRDLKLKENKP